jgi:NADPH2:quinone reductase
MAKELFEVVGAGIVRIGISDRAPLADVARVHRELEGRRTTASIVLIP